MILEISLATICMIIRIYTLIIKKHMKPARTMIVLGSGGHTSEMLRMVKDLDPAAYSPLICVHASSDCIILASYSNVSHE
jgi:hypothetical protein